MWEVEVPHRASRLPDSSLVHPLICTKQPKSCSSCWYQKQAEPCQNHQGLIRATKITFLPFSSLNRNSEKSLFFWKIRRVIIFSSLLALPQPISACVCTVARVTSSSPCLCAVVLVFANWLFVPVECCACRAEVIINWCLTFFVWLSLSDVIAAPLTNTELSLWEVSLKRGLLGATVDLKIWAPFYTKHTAHRLWNVFFTESERFSIDVGPNCSTLCS